MHSCEPHVPRLGYFQLKVNTKRNLQTNIPQRDENAESKIKNSTLSKITDRFKEFGYSKVTCNYLNGNVLCNGDIETLNHFAQKYLKYHYSDFYSTSDNVIFIPGVFNTHIPTIIDLKTAEKMLPDLKGDEYHKLEKLITQVEGEKVEEGIFNCLQDSFKDYMGKFIVFHSFKIAGRPQVSLRGNAEKDFIILLDIGYIINIECKWGNFESHKTLARKQTKGFRDLFEDWFADKDGFYIFKNKWEIVSIVHCKPNEEYKAKKTKTIVKNQEIRIECEPCEQFICENEDKLKLIFDKIKKEAKDRVKKEWANDLETIFSQMIFTLSADIPLVPRNLGQDVNAQMERQYSAENIIFYSRSQLFLLGKDPKKVIFNSHWGTGKTELLLQKAKEVAEMEDKMKDKKEVFLFICHDNKMESLFALQMTYQNTDNLKKIKFRAIKHENAFHSIKEEIKSKKGKCHVFVDEFHATGTYSYFVEGLRDMTDSLASKDNYLWLVLAGANKKWFHGDSKIEKDFTQLPKLEEFHVPKLTIPFRFPRSILEFIQKYGKDCVDQEASYLTIVPAIVPCSMAYYDPDNLVQGTTKRLEPIAEDNVEASIKVAIERFSTISRILFIATNEDHMETLEGKIKKVLINIDSQGEQDKLLVYGNPNFIKGETKRNDVISWITNQKDCKQKHLLASANSCKGLDYPYIIHFCDDEAINKSWNMNAMARCYAQLEVVIVNNKKLNLDSNRSLCDNFTDFEMLTF